jgi:hypothetical protein
VIEGEMLMLALNTSASTGPDHIVYVDATIKIEITDEEAVKYAQAGKLNLTDEVLAAEIANVILRHTRLQFKETVRAATLTRLYRSEKSS